MDGGGDGGATVADVVGTGGDALGSSARATRGCHPAPSRRARSTTNGVARPVVMRQAAYLDEPSRRRARGGASRRREASRCYFVIVPEGVMTKWNWLSVAPDM